jgi:RNA polymerase-interacting CarD/CdnL/TRCF family regulator
VRRRVLGTARDYLEIEMACESLRILVPCDATAAVGLRAIAGPRALQRIVDVLEAESEPELADENWSTRKRRNLAKLKDGDVLGLAAVIRDLVRRATAGNLLPSERQMLDRSRPVLASELRYALGVGAEQVDAYIDDHIGLTAQTGVARGPAGSGAPEPAHSGDL